MTAVQLVLNVAALASAYALVAIGFVLILNATGAVNFSHGDLVMVGGFGAVTLGTWLHVPGIVLLPLLLLGMGCLGVLVAVAAYFPLRKRPPESVFLSTIALGIVLQNAANLIYGAEPRAAPALFGAGQVRIGRSSISLQDLAIIVVAAGLILALYAVFTRTQTGRRLRATAQDPDVASAIGIRVDAMVAATFAVATALAGAAGLLLANVFFVTPTDGANYILKAYIAVTIGGWGSIPGAVVGALLIAAFEVVYPSLPLLVPGLLGGADQWFSQTVSTIAMDVVILAILVLRPQGLFGETVRQRP